jgi:dihydroneopterin triphosphate diphosphatase
MNVRYDMVACYVVRPGASGKAHEFLLLRRAAGDFMAGAWSVVRGTRDEGETASAAAVRELREETGLAPRELYQLDTVDVFYLAKDDTIWHCPAFCAIVHGDAPVVLDAEHDDFRWVDRSRIESEVLWPGERIQLAELCREILDDGRAKQYLKIP